jgi:HlyD family secretion protein
MRTLIAVLIGIVLLSTATSPDRATGPTVAADTVTVEEVPDSLLVERPVGAPQDATSSVFVVAEDGVTLRRVRVEYGRASSSMIQIVSGVSPGDRIVVSDMRAWDAFERLQLKGAP